QPRDQHNSYEPLDELVLQGDYTSQIKNPLLRFLHAQAYGRTTLPLYAGIEGREQLLNEIRARAGILEVQAQAMD
ncbi:MAG: hypothetical protein H7Y32_05065, partial [Chloroflexales bacterium]|nr:hypothetical protein [Chloroflexales bacterium]